MFLDKDWLIFPRFVNQTSHKVSHRIAHNLINPIAQDMHDVMGRPGTVVLRWSYQLGMSCGQWYTCPNVFWAFSYFLKLLFQNFLCGEVELTRVSTWIRLVCSAVHELQIRAYKVKSFILLLLLFYFFKKNVVRISYFKKFNISY